MPRFIDGLLHLLAGEPWMERRKGERRLVDKPRYTPSNNSHREKPRSEERRREDRRGRGWLRFWNPP